VTEQKLAGILDALRDRSHQFHKIVLKEKRLLTERELFMSCTYDKLFLAVCARLLTRGKL
jgi:hypothetical protein